MSMRSSLASVSTSATAMPKSMASSALVVAPNVCTASVGTSLTASMSMETVPGALTRKMSPVQSLASYWNESAPKALACGTYTTLTLLVTVVPPECCSTSRSARSAPSWIDVEPRISTASM